MNLLWTKMIEYASQVSSQQDPPVHSRVLSLRGVTCHGVSCAFMRLTGKKLGTASSQQPGNN